MELSGYIIEKYNDMRDAYTCNRLLCEAKKEKVNLKIVGVYDTAITEKCILNSGRPLEKRDFVICRYKWGKVKDAIGLMARKSYNSLENYNLYINKYEQIKKIHTRKLDFPKYILGTVKVPFERISKYLKIPFVAKGLESSMGDEIILINTEDEYNELLKTYGEKKEWLFEEFIKSSYGRDIRVYSIRGNVVACMQRISQNDFRANVALGARTEVYEITPQIKEIAKAIYYQTKLDFVGIDLLLGDNKFVFCEINVMPGIKGIEKATGINVANQIIKTIKGDFFYG